MIKKLLTKILWFIGKNLRIHAINRNLANLNHYKILKNKKYSNEKHLINHGFKSFSQSDEDGIIEEIFKRIETKSKKFLEVGVQDGLECNTTYLLHNSWSGTWIEQDHSSCDNIKKNFEFLLDKKLKIVNQKVTVENIDLTLKKEIKDNEEIDFLSIDIGTHTFHVLEKIINNINPRVIVTEYNAKYGPSSEWKIKYNPKLNWDGTDYFGASLKSFEIMLKQKNYSLIGCNITGVNAFFLRSDEINDKFINNFSSEFHYEALKVWLTKAFEPEHKVKIGEFDN